MVAGKKPDYPENFVNENDAQLQANDPASMRWALADDAVLAEHQGRWERTHEITLMPACQQENDLAIECFMSVAAECERGWPPRLSLTASHQREMALGR